MTIENLDEMLQKAFDESTRIYAERGFQRRIGFGKKPAIISVDLANAWTRPGNPFSCDMDKMDNEIDAISGATITGDGVSDMIIERIENYLPYFNSLNNE